MAAIRYNPSTGGSTLGDAGDFFKGASISLNQAISGVSSAFDDFRTG